MKNKTKNAPTQDQFQQNQTSPARFHSKNAESSKFAEAKQKPVTFNSSDFQSFGSFDSLRTRK